MERLPLPPRYPCGHINIPRTAAKASLAIHSIGTALGNSASILAEIRDQLPPRGPLTELYRELVDQLAWAENTWLNADAELMDIAYLASLEDACHWIPDVA